MNVTSNILVNFLFKGSFEKLQIVSAGLNPLLSLNRTITRAEASQDTCMFYSEEKKGMLSLAGRFALKSTLLLQQVNKTFSVPTTFLRHNFFYYRTVVQRKE